MSRPAAARDVALCAIMVAMIEACKLCMQALPNIELTSFLLILFSLRFRRLTLYVVPVFTLIEGLLYGFGLWWVMYLYAWPLLTLAVRPFDQVDSAFFWAVFSGVFGLLFGLLCALPYFFIGFAGGGLTQGITQMFAWWVAGIPFDIIHCVSNFALMLVLYRPMSRLLDRLPDILARP